MGNNTHGGSFGVPCHQMFATYEKDERAMEPEHKRRHKNRCVSLDKKTNCCMAAKCGCFGMKCCGANQCEYYSELNTNGEHCRLEPNNDDEYMQELKAVIANRVAICSTDLKYQEKSQHIKSNETEESKMKKVMKRNNVYKIV